jgi:hypothetical protein
MFFNKFFYIFDVKEHEYFKEKILGRINFFQHQNKNLGVEEYISFISNTDWQYNSINWYENFLSINDKKRYQEFIKKTFRKNVIISNTWFNQYYPNSGSDHPFHDHGNYGLSNVYIIEMLDKSMRTVLKSPKTGKEIIPTVKEGQILIFPSHILHKSPRNFTNKRKTIISFNSIFTA